MVSITATNPPSAEAALAIQVGRLLKETEVMVRLCGRVGDVVAVGGHWGIEIERPSGIDLHDECSVDGLLSIRG